MTGMLKLMHTEHSMYRDRHTPAPFFDWTWRCTWTLIFNSDIQHVLI